MRVLACLASAMKEQTYNFHATCCGRSASMLIWTSACIAGASGCVLCLHCPHFTWTSRSSATWPRSALFNTIWSSSTRCSRLSFARARPLSWGAHLGRGVHTPFVCKGNCKAELLRGLMKGSGAQQGPRACASLKPNKSHRQAGRKGEQVRDQTSTYICAITYASRHPAYATDVCTPAAAAAVAAAASPLRTWCN